MSLIEPCLGCREPLKNPWGTAFKILRTSWRYSSTQLQGSRGDPELRLLTVWVSSGFSSFHPNTHQYVKRLLELPPVWISVCEVQRVCSCLTPGIPIDSGSSAPWPDTLYNTLHNSGAGSKIWTIWKTCVKRHVELCSQLDHLQEPVLHLAT